ncbi:MAG: UDP-N-acetylglucosamine pyrophosphorylase [Polyangiaceae bacterium]|nr:UDP-N-acetylglucosamine pyrophosphorylase [Polyangiaceae bacterium]
MNHQTLEQRIEQLSTSGVRIVDPRQIYVGDDVDVSRISAGVVLHPGTRLHGKSTWLGRGVEIGTEGPATVVDSVFDDFSKIASGYVCGAVLLRKASLGANAHVRPGTLMEEEASTAHAVGLKQTVLMSFVTLGSLINFCDCLMAGGTSRKDHAEVGSGYIHFNYTPWGKSGDKATPSLIGDVPRGVFLRERRIFLGGAGGLVGPAKVGFGAIAGAGQVVRNGVSDGHLLLQPIHAIDRQVDFGRLGPVEPRARKNVLYIGNLFALRTWYAQVRLPMCEKYREPVVKAAIALLDASITERVVQLDRFAQERGWPPIEIEFCSVTPCPFSLEPAVADHVSWVRSLSSEQVTEGVAWLDGIVAGCSMKSAGNLSATGAP